MDIQKLLKVIIPLIALVIFGLFFYYLGKRQAKIIITPPVEVEIIKDSIIREEIIKENEVIKWKIKEVEKNYDEEVSTIMSNSDSANFVYFSKYISDYNNQRTTSNN